MYSPKISEDLIPELYKISKQMDEPMTKVVNEVLKSYVYFYKKFDDTSLNEIHNVLENLLKNN